jgi:hypothetical protein
MYVMLTAFTDGGIQPLSGSRPIDAIALAKVDHAQSLVFASKILLRAEWFYFKRRRPI